MYKNYDSKKLGITVSRAAVLDETEKAIWMVTNRSSFLLKVDLITNEIIEGYKIPCELKKEYKYISMARRGDDLYISPYNGDKLGIFSLQNKNFTMVDIPLDVKHKHVDCKFESVCAYENCIYLVGANIHIILKYDIEKKRFENLYEDNLDGRFTGTSSLLRDGILYVPEYERNIIHKVDVCTGEDVTLSFESDGLKGITSIDCKNKDIYIACRNGNILLLKNTEFKICGNNSGNYLYALNISKDNSLVFFDLFSGQVMRLDKNGIKRLKLPYLSKCMDENKTCSKIEMVINTTEYLLFQARITGEFFKIDLSTFDISRVDIKIHENIRSRLIKAALQCSDFVVEGDPISLPDFLNNI